MTSRLFVEIWTRAVVLLVLIILTMTIGACQFAFAPASPMETPQLEVSIPASLILTDNDLPEILKNKWAIRGEPHSQIEAWQWSGAQGQLAQNYQSEDNRVSVTQNILQFATDEQAAKFWQEMKDDRIEKAFTEFQVVPLLSLEELPSVHANDVLLRCESYSGVHFSICEVRLRYGSVYTSVKLWVNPPAMISLKSLYDIVANVDKRMQPVWNQ